MFSSGFQPLEYLTVLSQLQANVLQQQGFNQSYLFAFVKIAQSKQFPYSLWNELRDFDRSESSSFVDLLNVIYNDDFYIFENIIH